MKTVKVHLSFATRIPRDDAILAVEKICEENHVSILDCRMFSNLSLVLEIEGKRERWSELCRQLTRNSFHIEFASQEQMETLSKELDQSLLEGTLQITFSTGDGSLMIPVPSVPG